MPVIVEPGALRLYGTIYFNDGSGDVILASHVAEALSRIERDAPLSVYINCPGGHAMDSMAIHAMLTGRSGRVDTIVEGLAASGGSLIAMAGRTITMMPGALMMIHDAWAGCHGPADAHRDMAADLDLMSDGYAKIYASRTRKTAAACRALMKAETWFSPETAVASKFADRIGAGSAAQALAFDYSLYANAPEHLLRIGKAQRDPSHIVEPKENEMATDSEAVKARLRDIMKSPAAAGRAEMAEHLAFETDLPAAAAIALLEKAPAGAAEEASAQAAATAAYDARRLAAASLALPSGGREQQPAQARVDLTASMKRRHGIV